MKNSNKQKENERKAHIKSSWIHKGKIFSLRRDHIQFVNHPPHDWDIIVHPGAVAIIPVAKSGNLVLINQWRRAINKIIYELPAGTLEENESPLVCAQRELQEEIGYKANTLTPLGGLYSAPGFSTEYIHLFIATDLEESRLPQDTHEGIDIAEISLEKALNLIDIEEIDDAKTIAGILRYQRWLKNQ